MNNHSSSAQALGTSSATSLASSYHVPAVDGRVIPAMPTNLCLKWNPPTIAVVYTRKYKGKMKKYVHEIHIDFKDGNIGDMNTFCDSLCRKESVYLNEQIIKK